MSPVYLALDEILEIHRGQIDRYGGSHGVRDMESLTSAITMPAMRFGGAFLHKDIYEMASAYLYHIVQNHPFIDGNKRVGTVAAIVFLAINDIKLEADPNELAILVLSVACGNARKPEIAEYLRENSN